MKNNLKLLLILNNITLVLKPCYVIYYINIIKINYYYRNKKVLNQPE